MIPIPIILITIVLRIILIFVLKVQLNFYKEKYIFMKKFCKFIILKNMFLEKIEQKIFY